MCFDIDGKHPNEKTASKDIICYKTLYYSLSSFWTKFKYSLNELYQLEHSLLIGNDRRINKGFHSWTNKVNTIKFMHGWKDCCNLVIVKCIIPKGSIYYYNSERHEYVSNAIIIKEIIEK